MAQTKEEVCDSCYKKQLQKYYWLCFVSEFSKIIIFFVIFLFLGLTKEYGIALLSLMLLRSNGGGLHFEHYISCLLVSFSFLCGSIFLAMFVTPPHLLVCIVTLLCVPAGYYFAPITSSNRPKATPEQIKRSKQHTAFLILLFFILCFLCPHNTYLYISFWTVVLHIAQLAIAYFTKEVKKCST